MDTLYTKMRKSATANSGNTAIVFYGKRYSFKQILSLTDKAAEGLKNMGIKKGSVVTLCMPNTPSAQIAFYALNRLGAIVSLVHPYISAAQLDSNITAAKSSLLIAYDLFLSKKGNELSVKIPVLKSRSDYFMSGIAKIYFKFINRKEPKYDCPIFESLFAGGEITDEPQAFEENQPAVYLPSGGTTSTPKIIMHSCRVFNELCSHASYFLSEPLANYNTMYSVLPIFHGFGLCMNMHMCSTVGIKNVMSIKFNAKSMAKAIKKEGVNVITGVPAMYEKLLADLAFSKTDLSTLKDCFVGGDSAPKRLIEKFNAALTAGGSKARLYEGYGLTETVTVCTVGCKNHDRAGSVGYPLPDANVKIVKDGIELPAGEVGEICVSTPLLMLGYLDPKDCLNKDNNKDIADLSSLKDEKSKDEAGLSEQNENPIKIINGKKWLFTGDLGYVDTDGFLYFKQRIKNMIKISGIPVFPSEIEEVVEAIDGVARAAAIGINQDGKQSIKLFVESKLCDTEALKQAIIAECKLKLIPYALPKEIEIRHQLPLNTIGKIDRKKL